MRLALTAFLFLPALVFGQAASDVMMMIDLENVVWYYNEGTDTSKLLTSSAITAVPSTMVWAMKTYLLFGDVAALNGRPAKGAFIARGTALNVSTALAPLPQRPIADINRNQIFDFMIEVQDSAGIQVGTLAGLGFGGGGAPPGTPPGSAAGNFVIVGGSGAYSGARGQGATVSAANLRTASAVEDPAYRRVNGGGKWRIGVTLNGVARPEVVGAFHADFSPVTSARPAQSGETLILAVKGAGPTKPVLEPDKVFAQEPLAQVTSCVEATVNGSPAEVSSRVGWPGARDVYRIDVTLPGGISPGTAMLVMSVAWVPGAEFSLPVR